MNERDYYQQMSTPDLHLALTAARQWRKEMALIGKHSLMVSAQEDVLAILDELASRAQHTPRRHLAPERGRGRVWDSQNAGGE